jgi:hypothetical protein
MRASPVPVGRAARLLASLTLLSLLAVGCVRTVEARKPIAQANLIITRGAEGARLTWESVPGQVYSVQMKDRNRPEARWEFHPQALNLVGTGQTMNLVDRAPPGVTRQYRLHLLPVSGTRVPAAP